MNEALAASRPAFCSTMPDELARVDVDALLTINSLADVARRRQRLWSYVWSEEGLPTHLPTAERDVVAPDLARLRCGRVDRLRVPLPYQMTSTSYVLWPRGDVNGFAIYHTGHGDPHAPPYDEPMCATMQALLDRGFVVAAVDLPLLGWNHQPIAARHDASTPIWSEPRRVHEIFADYERPGFSALRFFLDPLALLVNHSVATLDPDRIAMIGLSGGGWATTVYAAIDPRVTHSYPVAGSWPFYLRGLPRQKPNFGDWEQRKDALPGFYEIAGYLDLYAMGAAGSGRRQLQILNRFDPVCFQGIFHRSYGPVVARRVALLRAGRWDVLEDATHGEHTLSPFALSVLLWDLDD